jgi:acyl-CoA synthetase (AMP-forming)/AMP-acid ligase II
VPNSKRNAVRSERPTTVPPWLIALLAVLIGGALWMLFPKQALERRLADTADDSELSLNYLSNLLKSDPGNERLQALLKAKQQRLEAIKQARRGAQAGSAQRCGTGLGSLADAVPALSGDQTAGPWIRWSGQAAGTYGDAGAQGRAARRSEPGAKPLSGIFGAGAER